MRLLITLLAVLIIVPGLGATAAIVVPPEPEQLVEGHTVFTVIQTMDVADETQERFAAAVAVLVREHIVDQKMFRFPGVLWFNDQYLVCPGYTTDNKPYASGTCPANDARIDPVPRYPCGAVIAVNAGGAVPTDPVSGMPHVPADATYVESYKVTDPEDKVWNVDKWLWNGAPMWSVAVGAGSGSEALYGTPDDGTTTCGSVTGGEGATGCLLPFVDNTPRDYPIFEKDPVYNDSKWTTIDGNRHEGRGDVLGLGCVPTTTDSYMATGDQSPTRYGFPCGTPQQSCPNRLIYNAVLFFFLDDLTAAGANKDHTDGSVDYNSDVSGCDDRAVYLEKWPCPAGDDNREGNSHPYNPINPRDETTQWPFNLAEGRNNHGGSCDVGQVGETYESDYCHATRNIDIYFGYKAAVLPVQRNWVVYDTEGASAPFHCHEDVKWCNEEDFSSQL